ncbi:MAG: ATP-binding protein [Planctomycetes bacterium]|nr:ATP-binding protein [Planctomycetota bacterium]
MPHVSDCPCQLSIPSDLGMLGVVRAFVEAVCQTGDLDRSITHAIVLATGEAVSNIIRHAHRECPNAQLRVGCRLMAEAMEVVFVDEGQPFDLDNVPRLDPGELRVGGRGVFLMRALMDEVTCEQRQGGGNILRMVKSIRPETQAATA